MMDRQNGKFVIECNTCDEVLETNTGDFTTARERLEAERWRARKVKDEWEHYCPRCSSGTRQAKR
jgi:hypothetical protein